MGRAAPQQQKYTHMTVRLFVGLRPPPAIRARLLEAMHGIAGARWQSEAQLHLTLRFIGEVDERTGDDIAGQLGRVRAGAPTMVLSGVGHFARRGRSDAVWASVAPAAPLAELHRKVDRAVVAAGLPPESRAFVPHITLARLNRSSGPIGGWITREGSLTSPPFACDAMLLFESHLGRDGAHYSADARFPFD